MYLKCSFTFTDEQRGCNRNTKADPPLSNHWVSEWACRAGLISFCALDSRTRCKWRTGPLSVFFGIWLKQELKTSLTAGCAKRSLQTLKTRLGLMSLSSFLLPSKSKMISCQFSLSPHPGVQNIQLKVKWHGHNMVNGYVVTGTTVSHFFHCLHTDTHTTQEHSLCSLLDLWFLLL